MDAALRAQWSAVVALGSNVASGRGSPGETVLQAFAALRAAGLEIRAASRLWRTPCMPAGAGPDYVNAVVHLCCGPDARALLDVLHRIEADFDRARTGRWAARTLDLDLIDHAGQVLPDAQTQARWRALPPERQPIDAPDRLILPHPRLQDRAFVLVPLSEAVPDWRDPVSGRPVAALLAALPPGARDGMAPLPRDAAFSSASGLSSPPA